MDLARRVKADYLAPRYRLAALGVVWCRRGGLPCVLWTVDFPDLIRRYAADPRSPSSSATWRRRRSRSWRCARA